MRVRWRDALGMAATNSLTYFLHAAVLVVTATQNPSLLCLSACLPACLPLSLSLSFTHTHTHTHTQETSFALRIRDVRVGMP